ncbi:MAG: preQ(1) synthase [Planctomycetes bacterium]|nr:preQ(1) synthase [Planctomycetota bacterium]
MARTRSSSCKAPLRGPKQLPSATLGKRSRAVFTYDPDLLEAIPFGVGRTFATSNTWVSDNCLRFTSLCPVTGQPDWADLFINFIPAAHLIESKSLKEYLHGFRMHGGFHEDVCRVICDDLARCMQPRYLEIIGHFDSRGSIAIWPFVQYANPGDAAAEQILQHRLLNYTPGKYAPDAYGRNI